ncbi:MAG: hypothetical protein E7107_08405 [Prevotella sp.]|nr:hypothetical protein [Prevotella sp.]
MKRIAFVLLLVVGSINILSAQKLKPISLSEIKEIGLSTPEDTLMFALGYSLPITQKLEAPQDSLKFIVTFEQFLNHPNDNPEAVFKKLSDGDELALSYYINAKSQLSQYMGTQLPYKMYFKGLLSKAVNDTSIVKTPEDFISLWSKAQEIVNTLKISSVK